MKSATLRESFLKYFESKTHRRIKSASLIPENDPTLFFTNAGMVQFKDVFTGKEDIGTRRATTSQKCMRVSGKHNDLENVGRTLRHHTFFEMLGNFSFGDYFKKDAIKFAWEFLTEVLRLEKSKLWVTVFREDAEAEKLWLELTDVPASRILKMDESDNFWSMGETGPCGPCTEIHYDFEGAEGKTEKQFLAGSESGRIMEIWNLVFMQFDRSADGKMNPLPKPSVDTGMGLERLAAVVQGVFSNYDSDLFKPLIQYVVDVPLRGTLRYGDAEDSDVSLRVIADHIRAMTFLVGDGVMPSNEGRGYVLRRVMRRAIRHGRLLNIQGSFLFAMVPEVIRVMGNAYPELSKNVEFIQKVIASEENKFQETLDSGIQLINEEFGKIQKSKGKVLSGEVAFKLYDTFGFPLDLTEILAKEKKLTVDIAAFEKLMEGQREKARASWKGSGETKTAEVHQQLIAEGLKTQFLGYQTLDCTSRITALVKDGQRIDEAVAGEIVEVYCECSPFYAESGGQVGDQGFLLAPKARAVVEDTQKPAGEIIAHFARVESGVLKVGDEIHLQVNPKTRGPTRLNHTATHLLHAALRKVLGAHVKQAGSLVAPDRLRFDFSHFQSMTPEQIMAVEDLVNEKIREDIEVKKTIMGYDEAMKQGAMALFGEKYGNEVRVLQIADYSTELCGGTHVDRTGEIGSFKILSESSVASGVRRIEAMTGADTIQYLRKLEGQIQDLARQLKVAPEEVLDRVAKQGEQLKKAEREISKLKAELAGGGSGGQPDVSEQIKEIGGVKVLASRRDLDDVEGLRALSDQMIQKLGSGIAVLGSAANGKATLIVRVSKDLTGKFKAGDIVKELAKEVGGSGGGRPDMAQAGGPDVAGLDRALEKVGEVLKEA
jgi:alanyl-tRNA synthetase